MSFNPKVMEIAAKRFNDRKMENKLIHDKRHAEICK